MSDITVTFKNETILTMDASGSKPLLTRGKYCEDDISISYVKPAAPTGTKQISITENGTVTEDVAAYANAEINVNVQGGGGWTTEGIAAGTEPSGDLVVTGQTIAENAFCGKTQITSVTGANVTSIGASAFADCQGLETVQFPVLVTINTTYIFQNCHGLEIVNFPALTTTPNNGYIFYYLGSNENSRKAVIVLPAISSLGSRTFDRVFADKVDLGPNLSTLTADQFYDNLTRQTVGTLILRRTASIVSAVSKDAIKGLRDVYVPSALIADYEAATNWVDRVTAGFITFHAIEGSIYETQYADGTPIT